MSGSPSAGSAPPLAGGSRAQHPPALGPGDTFGRYAIEAVLGEGAMGRVYRALDTRLGRRVALKIILVSPGADVEDRVARLEREGRAAAAFDHPGAVAVYDCGEIDGVPFISMELVAGKPLRQLIGVAGVDWPTRVRWLVDIAAALAAAHRSGIVHRDIKPDNVMITADGRGKVLDFGIARRIAGVEARGPGADLATLTQEGGVVGTPAYMSPEQIQARPLDGRSDQFSFGALAHELLAERPLWPRDPMPAMFQIISAAAPSIRDARPDIPAALAAVVARTLAKDPGQRFASMDDVVAALEPFAAPSPRGLSAAPPARDGLDGAGGPEPQHASRDDAAVSTFDPNAPPVDALAATALLTAGAGGAAVAATVDLRTEAPAPAPATSAPALATSAPATSAPAPATATAGLASAQPAEPTLLPSSATVATGRAARSRLRAVAPLLLLAACVVALLAYRRERARPVPVTDLPAPRSSSPEAIASYRQGLAAHRRNEGARVAFARAVELDPTLAAAHLQLVMRAAGSSIDDTARRHFDAARQHQAALSPRDRAILDALEPLVHRQPSDWTEAARRMSAVLARFPHDAQGWYAQAIILASAEGLPAAVAALDHALAEDPEYASAIWLRGEQLSYLGRFAEAKASFAACNQLTPTALDCSLGAAAILQQEGACDGMETVARQVIAAQVERRAPGYLTLARSLASQGKPAETVREAIRAGVSSLKDPADRRETEHLELTRWALWTGDFDAAERDARAYAELVEARRERAPHAQAALLLAEILEETDRGAEAGRAALSFLNRADAWEPDPRAEDFALAADATPRLLAVARRVGALGREDFSRRRAAWVADWERRVARDVRSYIWLHGYAAVADTPEDARAAMEALPRFGAIPPFRPRTFVWMGVGPAYLLTGRAAAAVPWLEGATRSCHALGFPVEHTHAHAWLGRAREAQGDTAGACAAYRVVLQRWGQARPRSVTLEFSRARLAALGCEP
ncbi:MAG: serine/threonine-protein kinase [Minicystis sp.]